jgi:hypothetical protein
MRNINKFSLLLNYKIYKCNVFHSSTAPSYDYLNLVRVFEKKVSRKHLNVRDFNCQWNLDSYVTRSVLVT